MRLHDDYLTALESGKSVIELIHSTSKPNDYCIPGKSMPAYNQDYIAFKWHNFDQTKITDYLITWLQTFFMPSFDTDKFRWTASCSNLSPELKSYIGELMIRNLSEEFARHPIRKKSISYIQLVDLNGYYNLIYPGQSLDHLGHYVAYDKFIWHNQGACKLTPKLTKWITDELIPELHEINKFKYEICKSTLNPEFRSLF